MSKWNYLDGKRWSQITRDERFFCQRLLVLAEKDLPEFVRKIGPLVRDLDLSGDDWELAYEVCFYRDLKYARLARGLTWPLGDEEHSDKRTWDLCLFSPSRIIIIEAKAQQSFGTAQLREFDKDLRYVPVVAGGIKPEFVFLASSRYLTERVATGLRSSFPGSATVTWKALAGVFNQDPDLKRADSLFAEKSKSGDELLALWRTKLDVSVGRAGGIKALRRDVEGAAWRDRLYPIGGDQGRPNWFSLEKFIEVVAPNELRK